MSNLFIQESFVNKTENYSYGESDVYETFTGNIGDLFKSLQQEHGRCKGKVYVDGPNGTGVQIGWIFQKRAKYSDVDETYLQETWVSVHTDPPTKTCTYHYKEF